MAAANPATTAVSPDSFRAVALPCRSASVRISPAAPGARSSTIAVTTCVKVSWSSAAARPTTAISAGRSVSVAWNASAREWLKPSAARKRVIESLEQRHATELAQRLECVVALELSLGLGYRGGRAQASSGWWRRTCSSSVSRTHCCVAWSAMR